MALVSSKSGDNGLGYYATCDCEDFLYRQEQVPMSQEQINSRWDRARDKLHSRLNIPYDDVARFTISGGIGKHEVLVSKGEGNAGPNFYCAHCFAALVDVISSNEALVPVAFGCPDTNIPQGYETVSVDGWMVALIEKRKEKRE